MPISLATNLSAIQAQRYLDNTSKNLSKSFERLSSGLRINSPSDDAAGLAVAMKLGQKINVLGRAKMNVDDGISLLNTADGAAQQIENLLYRMSELAQEASNGVLTDSQRNALNQEYSKLDQEIGRIIATTKFNGNVLFEGEYNASSYLTLGSASGGFQVGGSSGDGRYFVLRPNSVSADNRFVIYDSLANSLDTIMEPNGRDITDIKMTASGDIVYSATNGSATDLYFYDIQTKNFTKLTNSGDANDIAQFDISNDGRKVVFSSYTQYVLGGTLSSGTSAGAQRIFVVDTNTGKFDGIAQDVSSINSIFINSDGTKIAFDSNSDLTGSNGDGNKEIFGFTIGDTSFTQVTDTTSTSSIRIFGISTSGNIYFTSSRTELDSDASGDNEFYIGSLSDQSVTQFLNLNQTISITDGVLNTNTSKLYFNTSTDLTGENPNNYQQIFSLDLTTASFTQLTKLTVNASVDDIYISPDGSNAIISAGNNALYLDLSPSSKSVSIDTSDRGNSIVIELEAILANVSGLGGYTISSQDSAQAALSVIKDNIDEIAKIRGKIGAEISRLEKTSDSLGSRKLENDSALSRIRDIDTAQETANMVSLTVRQQSAMAILAQANLQPDIVLSLII